MSDSPIEAVVRAIDALDVEAATGLFGQESTLSTAFGARAEGIDQVTAALSAFFSELRQTRHALISTWHPEAAVWLAEMTATYELSDFSRRGPYRRVFVLRGDAGRIRQLRIYGAHEQRLAEAGQPYLSVRDSRGWLPTL